MLPPKGAKAKLSDTLIYALKPVTQVIILNVETVKDRECCSSWGCKESDMTFQLNNNNNEQLNTNKLDNLEEMDKFLEIYSLSRPNHE